MVKTHPTAAYLMLIFMLSLGGIPPTMGFMGKWSSSCNTAGRAVVAGNSAGAGKHNLHLLLPQSSMVMCFTEPDADTSSRTAASLVALLALIATERPPCCSV